MTPATPMLPQSVGFKGRVQVNPQARPPLSLDRGSALAALALHLPGFPQGHVQGV